MKIRTIIFRGKRIDNGEWIEGYFFKSWDKTFLLWGMTGDSPDMVEVISETVGQFTGLTDKNGKKIFEGDIVKCLSLEYGYLNKEVYYSEGKAKFALHSCGTDYEFDEYINVEVVGDIHDDAELLGE